MKKKYLLVASIFILLVSALKSQTFIFNNISSNTIWSKNNSPYIILDNIVIEPGVTLTISPGTVVRIRSNKRILVLGNLTAKGTVSERISFVSDTTGNLWAGFTAGTYSVKLSPTIDFKQVIGSGVNNLIRIYPNNSTDTLLKIQNSTFTIFKHGIIQPDTIKKYKVFIDSSDFSSGGDFAIGASNHFVSNSKFSNGQSGFASTALQSSIVRNSEFNNIIIPLSISGLITNCEFKNNTIAINLTSSNTTTISNNEILVNTIGIYLNDESSAYITKNKINLNTQAISMYKSSSATISYNEIIDNTSGIGCELTSSLTTISKNKICNKNSNLVMKGLLDIQAYYNCFCLSDTSAIAARIHNFNDGVNIGKMLFVPFDKYCEDSGPNGISRQNVRESILVHPNPTSQFVTIYSDTPIQVLLISDIRGNVVKSFTGDVKSTRYDVSMLETGLYIITIKCKIGVFTKKIIKN